MSLLFIITSVAFFIWLLRNIFFWVYLWQLKEYRFDRVFIHLRETKQGSNLLFSSLSLLKWVLLIAYLYVVFYESYLYLYQFIVSVIFFTQAVVSIREYWSSMLKRPAFTTKALLLTIASFIIVGTLYTVPPIEKFFWLLLLDKITPFIIGFFVFLLSFPTALYRDLEIDKAVEKIRSHRNLLVIGVTGSYGKSSTKEYTAQILGQKFNVLKTKGTNNTPIGIAKTILSSLKNKTQVFVVEMGAYKKGEIEEMCQIVRPKIGILTAVSSQHLSLFGSLKNTLEAKYEIISSLPRSGVGLFNGNNDNVYNLYKNPPVIHKNKGPRKKILYGTKNGISDVYATNIKARKNSIIFDVVLDGKVVQMKTPLIGSQNVENILPGIYIGYYLGMHIEEIKKAVTKLTSVEKTMFLHTSSINADFVDDTFNSNPDAVLAAITYMKLYKGKKVLVLQPMIELGRDAREEHYNVGREIGAICDYVFLTNKNFYKDITRGIKSVGKQCIVKVKKPLEIADFLNAKTTKGDIILFEGKEAAIVLNKMT